MDDESASLLAVLSDAETPDALAEGSLRTLWGILLVSTGTERSGNISPPKIFVIFIASSASMGPIFCLVCSKVPGAKDLSDPFFVSSPSAILTPTNESHTFW